MSWADYSKLKTVKPPVDPLQPDPSITTQGWGPTTQPSTTTTKIGTAPSPIAPSPSPSPSPAITRPWQDIYGEYRTANPNPGTTSLSGLYDAFKAGGVNVGYVPHGGANSLDKLYIDNRMYDFGSGLDNPNGGGSWWDNPSPIDESGGGFPGMAQPQGPDPNDPIVQSMRAALLKLIGDSQQAPSINDPMLSAVSSAYRTARERSAGQERAALAERAAASGLNSGGQGSGAFDTGIQGIQEASGQDIAANDAGLVQQEVQQRRQQLLSALQLADALGARNEAAALQMQLANLDNQFRYSQLGQQQSQFEDTTAFNYADLLQRANRDAYLTGLGG